MRNILKKPDELVSFLSDSPKKHQLFVAFKILGEIQTFAEARRLSPDEIQAFEAKISAFHSHMRLSFPEISTPKFHILCAHAPVFVRNHGFFGWLSEQPMEAFHPKFNADMARRNNTWDMATRLLFAAKQSGIRNYLFDNGMFEKTGFVESNSMLNQINFDV